MRGGEWRPQRKALKALSKDLLALLVFVCMHCACLFWTTIILAVTDAVIPIKYNMHSSREVSQQFIGFTKFSGC